MNIADDLIKAFNDGYQQGKRDAVVRGEWIKKSSELTETLALCSKCSYPVAFWHKTNYCPNCGCDMRGESNGKE